MIGETRTLPTYASRNKIHEEFGVHEKILKSWSIKGYIRTAKLGDNRQSGRLYRVADVVEALEHLTVGKQPRCKVRTGKQKRILNSGRS